MQYALDKLQQLFMKTQLGMSVCLIKILTDTKESQILTDTKFNQILTDTKEFLDWTLSELK